MSQPSYKFELTPSCFMVFASKAIMENCNAVLGWDPHWHHHHPPQALFHVEDFKGLGKDLKVFLMFSMFLSLQQDMFHKYHLIFFTAYASNHYTPFLFLSYLLFPFLKSQGALSMSAKWREDSWVIWLPEISTYSLRSRSGSKTFSNLLIVMQ